MKCPYCNYEMERGRITVSAVGGSMSYACIGWYKESSFEQKGFFNALKRKSISIKSSNDGYYHDWFHCPQCKKVFGEFPTDEK